MSKKFNLKVTARVKQKCHCSIDIMSFNQLLMKNQDTSQIRKFQLDRIYQSTDTNQKLFENILRVPTNLLLDGFSSMVLCIGSPNSGKTYTLAGKMKFSNSELSEPGIITYLMRRFFSKFKHQVSLYSTYSVWCKVLCVENQQVTNMTNHLSKIHQPHQKISHRRPSMYHSRLNDQKENKIEDKIQIRNYSHFEEIIEAVYRKNNSKKHIIIDISIKKQLPSGKSTTSSITFVEFGSFFYSCPYREAQELQMQSQIQSVINLLKNLSKSSDVTQKLYQSSILTKVLKENIKKSTQFEIMGLIDESYTNNLKTLNFLDMLMTKRIEPRMAQNVKQQIKRQQTLLKNLYEKHRRVLNLLSRCIGMQLNSLQKKKKGHNFDGPIMNSFYKTCQKVKYANLKKLQNQKKIQQMRKYLQKQNTEIAQIQQKYKIKLQKIEIQRNKLLQNKKQLIQTYKSITNPQIKFNNIDYSLYWKPDQYDMLLSSSANNNKYPINTNYNGGINQGDQENMRISSNDSDHDSKQNNNNKSFNLVPSENIIPSATHNFTNKYGSKLQFSTKLKIHNKTLDKYQRKETQINDIIKKRTIKQMKRQAGKLFHMIIERQKQIENSMQILQADKQFNMNCLLCNRIKNRPENAKFDYKKALQCYELYLSDKKTKKYLLPQIHHTQTKKYIDFLETLKIQQKIQKDLENRNPVSSMNAISLRSLATEKNIKN